MKTLTFSKVVELNVARWMMVYLLNLQYLCSVGLLAKQWSSVYGQPKWHKRDRDFSGRLCRHALHTIEHFDQFCAALDGSILNEQVSNCSYSNVDRVSVKIMAPCDYCGGFLFLEISTGRATSAPIATSQLISILHRYLRQLLDERLSERCCCPAFNLSLLTFSVKNSILSENNS